jgi:hypothetical protein
MGVRLREPWALAAVVLGAMALSLVWAVRVPIFQAPDEPLHFDYALGIYAHRGPFRARDYPAPVNNNHYENIYTHDYVHPYTNFLIDYTAAGTIAFNPAAKIAADYGSAAYFRRLDQAAPNAGDGMAQAPFLARQYPFGYYALLAAWMGLLRCFQEGLTFLFFGSRILSVLLLGGTLVLVYASARELHGGRAFSLLITAAVGFFPLTSFVSSYVQPDNLSLFLTCFCYYLALRARHDGSRSTLLGIALGALLLTKVHYYLAVAVPIGAMLAGRLWIAPLTVRRRWTAVALLLGPSALAAALYAWTLGGDNVLYRPPALPYRPLPHLALWTKRAFHDYYVGFAQQSFWGIFGWLDAPLIIHDPITTRWFRAVTTAGTLTLLALTLLRLGQVILGLLRLLKGGRWRSAWRVAFSNPVINSYFLFTALMFVLYVRLQNAFGAQGRNWLPLLLPIFLTGTCYVPKVFRRPQGRRLCSAAVLAFLLLFDGIGGVYALRTIQDRYYAPFHGRPAEAVALDPAPPLVFTLNRPRFVYGLRLHYTLTTANMDRAALEVCWRGQNRHLPISEKKAILHVIPGAAPRTLTVCVNDTVEQFRLVPNRQPCRFALHEVVLLQKP